MIFLHGYGGNMEATCNSMKVVSYVQQFRFVGVCPQALPENKVFAPKNYWK